MEYVGRVHEEHSPEYLVDEVLYVVVAEFLPRVYHSVEISFHEFGDYIDIGVSGFGFRP